MNLSICNEHNSKFFDNLEFKIIFISLIVIHYKTAESF